MKFLKNHLFTLIAVVTTFVAATVASSACWWSFYQPVEPKSLREKE